MPIAKAVTISAVLCGLVIAAPELGSAAENSPQAPVSELIAQLDSKDYAARRKATQQLIAHGTAAIPALIEAAEGASLESAVRAVAVLREIYVASEGEAVDVTEAALEQLTQSSNRSIAGRAHAVLEQYYVVRQKRAIAAIRELGGVIDTTNAQDKELLDLEDPNLLLRIGVYVRLDRDWKGGDEGLRHVKRLTKLQQLYLVKGSGVTEKGEAELRRALPNVNIQHRGQACLGISGGGDDGIGCRVGFVKPGSSADKAGLQTGDLIMTFDGKPSRTFEDLVELIGTHVPGDKVKADIYRRGEQITLEIELGGWD